MRHIILYACYARACEGRETLRTITSAVAINGLLIVTSGLRGSFGEAFRLGGRGDLVGHPECHVSWKSNTPGLASPILAGKAWPDGKETPPILGIMGGVASSLFWF